MGKKMTGEMIKPENADMDESYWKNRVGTFGHSVIGDNAYLIRPNYPKMFRLKDILKKNGFPEAEIHAFDTYQGAFIKDNRSHCKIWANYNEDEYGTFIITDCPNKSELEGYIGDIDEILDVLTTHFDNKLALKERL